MPIPKSAAATPNNYIAQAAHLLDEHLAEAERRHSVVSLLAAGGAFESWLAFEARLLWERERERLGLDERYKVDEQFATHRYWLANETYKIDLYIGDNAPVAPYNCHSTFEFKLIHNNKNWQIQADRIWADLFPTRNVKTSVRPANGRFAVVGVVGKAYRFDQGNYPGERPDLSIWEEELERYLLPAAGWEGKYVERVWVGMPHMLKHDSLRPGVDHFFQLSVLTGTAT